MRVVPPAKRNPQDLTLRNLRALKKRVTILEHEVAVLMAALVVQGQARQAQARLAKQKLGRRSNRIRGGV